MFARQVPKLSGELMPTLSTAGFCFFVFFFSASFYFVDFVLLAIFPCIYFSWSLISNFFFRNREDVYRVVRAFVSKGEWMNAETERYAFCLVRANSKRGMFYFSWIVCYLWIYVIVGLDRTWKLDIDYLLISDRWETLNAMGWILLQPREKNCID